MVYLDGKPLHCGEEELCVDISMIQYASDRGYVRVIYKLGEPEKH